MQHPSDEDWRRWSRGDDPDAGVRELIAAHLNCDVCRQVLERIENRQRGRFRQIPHSPKPPSLSGYEPLDWIGHGGMGSVFKARQRVTGRIVAVKIIRPGREHDAVSIRRFRWEAESLARLRDPHIIQLHEAGESDGCHYFSMEFCENGSLAERLMRGRMPAAETASLMERVSRAVHAAHRAEIVHRDLKPANILLATDGSPRVSDFGLARLKNVSVRATRDGNAMGTSGYMPPEQIRGKMHAVGPAADIFAMGVILFECLTGKRPFEGSADQILLKTLHDEPPRFLWSIAGVPRDLQTICLRCLAKEPERRYPSAEDLAEDLRRWREHEPIRARRTGVGGRLRLWTRRRPAQALATASLVLLAGALLVASAVTVLWQDAAKARRELAALSYAHQLSLADTRRQEHRYGEMLELLSQCPEQDRNWEWHCLRDQCRLRGFLDGHLGTVTGVAVSPDGQRIASSSADGTVRVWNRGDPQTKSRVLSGHEGFVRCVAFHPDGSRLVSAGDDRIAFLWDVAGDRSPMALTGHTDAIHEATFSSDGRLVATGSLDQTVRVWDARTGVEFFATDRLGAGVFAVAFSPDGTRLVAGGQFQDLVVWNVASRKRDGVWKGPAASVDSVCFSPGGETLFSADRGFLIRQWDTLTGETTSAVPGHDADINCLCVAGLGRWIASGGDDSALRIWSSADLSPAMYLHGHRGHVVGVAACPDGTTLVTGSDDSRIGIWNIGESGAAMRKDDDVSVRRITFDPEGTLLASGHADGTVRLQDVATGKVTHLSHRQGDLVTGLSFNPRGDRLASVSDDCRLRIWNVSSREKERELSWPRPSRPKPVVKDNSRRPALGDLQRPLDPTRRTQNVARDVEVMGPILEVSPVSYSRDGRSVVCGCFDGRLRIWDTVDWSPREMDSGHLGAISCLSFNGEGNILATGGVDHTLRIWDWPSLRFKRNLTAHQDYVYQLAFSPDGSHMASASADFRVIVWRIESGAIEHSLTGHTDNVTGVAYSPDGQRLATAGWDGTLRIWDTILGRELLTLRTKSRRPHDVRFSPDGHTLAYSGDGGYIEQWLGSARPAGW